ARPEEPEALPDPDPPQLRAHAIEIGVAHRLAHVGTLSLVGLAPRTAQPVDHVGGEHHRSMICETRSRRAVVGDGRRHRDRPRAPLAMRPRLAPVPLALAAGVTIIYLLNERFLDVSLLSATCFGVASYGLIGLYLPCGAWVRGLPAALLLVAVLPFGEQADTW